MEILISNNQDLPVDEEILRAVAAQALNHEGAADNVELSIALVDEEEIRRLNKMYRGKDTSTDVLSFETANETDLGTIPFLIGDVVICPTIAKRQAGEYGSTFEEEMSLLVIHGTLHLLGYGHETDVEADAMETIEQLLLAEIAQKALADRDDSDEK